jgi:hypothetical protein
MPVFLKKAVKNGHVLGQFRVEVKDKQVTVSATTGTGVGSAVLEELPDGMLFIAAATAVLDFTSSAEDLANGWNGDYAIGTSPTTDATIVGTESNLIPVTAIGPASGRVIGPTRGTRNSPINIDNFSGSAEVNINLLVDAANITDNRSAVITVNGTIDLLLSYVA